MTDALAHLRALPAHQVLLNAGVVDLRVEVAQRHNGIHFSVRGTYRGDRMNFERFVDQQEIDAFTEYFTDAAEEWMPFTALLDMFAVAVQRAEAKRLNLPDPWPQLAEDAPDSEGPEGDRLQGAGARRRWFADDLDPYPGPVGRKEPTR
jgi:hypothetical protein